MKLTSWKGHPQENENHSPGHGWAGCAGCKWLSCRGWAAATCTGSRGLTMYRCAFGNITVVAKLRVSTPWKLTNTTHQGFLVFVLQPDGYYIFTGTKLHRYKDNSYSECIINFYKSVRNAINPTKKSNDLNRHLPRKDIWTFNFTASGMQINSTLCTEMEQDPVVLTLMPSVYLLSIENFSQRIILITEVRKQKQRKTVQ